MSKVSRRFIEELKQELPQWVADGTVSEGAAAQLRSRYEKLGAESRSGLMHHLEIMFRVLCALLLGGGVILLISHNWDMLAPGWRMAAAYLPLLASLGFGAWVVVKNKRSPAWCEPAAILIGATAASAIAIVSQLYHTLGTLQDFLFFWLLLLLPFLYLFRSFALSVIYTVGCMWLFNLMRWDSGSSVAEVISWSWVFAAAVSPMLCLMSKPGNSPWLKFFGRLMILVLLLQLQIISVWGVPGILQLFCWLAFCTVITVCGLELARYEEKNFNVFFTAGSIATLAFAFFFSFGPDVYSGFWRNNITWEWLLLPYGLILIGGVVLWGVRKFNPAWLFPLLPPLVYLLFLSSGAYQERILGIAANVGLIAYGVYLIRNGFVSRSSSRINFAILILATLIFCRFASAGNILLMALSFIVLGVLVGASSIFVSRWAKKGEPSI